MTHTYSYVAHLFLKTERGGPMAAPPDARVTMTVGNGIDGDMNNYSMSPRQVLVTRHEDLNALSIKPGELRENIVIQGLDPTQFVPGTVLAVGPNVQLRLTFNCEPCKRVSHLVPSLKQLLRRRGILGVVIQGGTVAMEDSVVAHPGIYSPLSDVPVDRFRQFIAAIPPSRVVTYKQVTKGMGVADSYMRAIPAYIERALGTGLPLHRILDSNGWLIPYVPDQQAQLEAEGVRIHEVASLFQTLSMTVDVVEAAWEDPCFFIRRDVL